MAARNRPSRGKAAKVLVTSSSRGGPADEVEADVFPPAPLKRRPGFLLATTVVLGLWVAALAWLAFTGGKLTKPPRDAGAQATQLAEPSRD